MAPLFDETKHHGYPKSWLLFAGWQTQKVKTCFVTKSVRFGRTELLFFLESASRDLAIGHAFEACSVKNKKEILEFHTSWDQKAERMEK